MYIIKSNRTFGLEFELDAQTVLNENALRKNGYNIHLDGSLRDTKTIKRGVEIVSRVLKGHSGEEWVRKLCEFLNRPRVRKFKDTDPITSTHVHLGFERSIYKNQPRLSLYDPMGVYGEGKLVTLKMTETAYKTLQISESFRGTSDVVNKGKEEITVDDAIKTFKIHAERIGLKCSVTSDDSGPVIIVSRDGIKGIVGESITILIVREDREITVFDHVKIRNALYTYTLFSTVLDMMVPEWRRGTNPYVQGLHKIFNLSDIEKIKDERSFESLWYQGIGKGGQYNDSRYRNVNFHSLYIHGTIEIRSLNGTKDADKVLLWVRLHQAILDGVESGVFTVETLKEYENYRPDQLVGVLMHKLNSKMMSEYITRTVNYYK